MRICFYAAVRDRALFDLVEFYKQDIRILRELGHDVRPVNAPWGALGRYDCYWVWWPTSGVPAVLAARLRRRPCILVTAQSERDATASGLQSKGAVARLAVRASLALADVALATSRDTKAGVSRYPTRRLEYVPLGVDTDVYAPRPTGGREDAPYALTISHLVSDNVQRKRILDVVKTAAAVKASGSMLRFLIVGSHGDATETVRREITALGVGDRVTLLGRVSMQEKVSLLAGARVYFQPTEYEAFGMAIAEAMACETPVLSSAVGNVPDLIGRAGHLLPADATPDDFARALLSLVGSDDRTVMGRCGRQRIVERYSVARRRELARAILSEVVRRG